jgi:hypothetical protein
MRAAWLLAALLALALPASGQELEVLATTGKRTAGSSKKLAFFAPPIAGPQGQVAWNGYLHGDDGGGLWEQRNGRVRRLVRHAQRAPGLPRDLRIFDAEPIGYDAGGSLYAAGSIFVRGTDRHAYGATWRIDAKGRLEPLLRTHQPLPGVAEPIGRSFYNAAIGSAGHFAVLDETSRIFLRSPDGTVALAVSSETTPSGVPPGVGFAFLGSRFFVAADGTLAFEGFLDDAAESRGIWRRAPDGELSLVALEGTEPAGAPGTLLQSLLLARMNAAGKIVAHCTVLVGPAEWESCLLEAEAGAPAGVTVRDDDPAPGAPAGSVLAGTYDVWVGDDGSVTFAAFELPAPDASHLAQSGIWRRAGGGALERVARAGVALPGETAEVGSIGPIRWGSNGEILFQADFYGQPSGTESAWFAVPRDGAPVRVADGATPLPFAPDPEAVRSFSPGPLSYPRTDHRTAIGGGFVAFDAESSGRSGVVKIPIPAPTP